MGDDVSMEDFGALEKYHIPQVCMNCGGVMVFKGVGEYRCEECGNVDFFHAVVCEQETEQISE